MAVRPEIQTFETSDTIAQAFDSARKNAQAMTSTAEFHDACAAASLDPYDDMDKPAYWETFSAYAYDAIAAEAGDQPLTMEQEARYLLAETPRFLFAQLELDSRSSLTREQKNYDRSIASYYNGLVRNFATNHPTARVSDVKAGLLAMANISIEDKAVRQNAARAVHATLHGTQHELAFGQILGYTGLQSEAATLEQDLAGIDYMVQTQAGSWFGLDVKASDRLVTGDKRNQFLYTPKPGHPYELVVHSLTRDNELRDQFFTPEETAAKKSGYVLSMLAAAEAQAAKAV